MSDSIDQQKEIFGKVQSLMAFLDTTEQNKKRENLEQWKQVLESLRNISGNPIPFLLELLKNTQWAQKQRDKMAVARSMRAAKRRKRRGDKGDGEYKETKKSFAQKFNLGNSSNPWLRTLNNIIRESVMTVLPRVDEILLEEIFKAFTCDLSMLVPVDGDGLTGPIVIMGPLLQHLVHTKLYMVEVEGRYSTLRVLVMVCWRYFRTTKNNQAQII